MFTAQSPRGVAIDLSPLFRVQLGRLETPGYVLPSPSWGHGGHSDEAARKAAQRGDESASPWVKFMTLSPPLATKDSLSPARRSPSDRASVTVSARGAAFPAGHAHLSSARGDDRTTLRRGCVPSDPRGRAEVPATVWFGDEPLIEHDCHLPVAGRKVSGEQGPAALRRLHVLECHRGMSLLEIKGGKKEFDVSVLDNSLQNYLSSS